MHSAVDDLKNTLDYLSGIGCTGFDCSEKTLETLNRWKNEKKRNGKSDEDLYRVHYDLLDCTRCDLCRTRQNIVFGEGAEKASLVFVGEGPGAQEDMKGRPFVGKAGDLLTKIINAMNLDRKDVYICNVVKCRPPGNRTPNTEEISRCTPFLKRQLSAIGPKVICALGKCASQTLLQSDTPISRLRGHFYTFMGIKVMPTFHPAYLLRNPGMKKYVWEDVQKIMKLL